MRESVRELVFEVSWEVCNKVGGIHTVLVGKAPYAKQRFGERYILIGPYVVQGRQNWEESNSYSEWQAYLERRHGLRVYPGIWRVGDTQVPTWLIDFHALLGRKDEIFYELWESFGVDSLWGGWDYVEPAIFGYAAGMVIASFLEFYYGEGEVEVVAHFHEWLTGAGVLYLRRYKPAVATVFTTHATVVGRAAEGHPITQEPDRWAAERGLLAKHTLERAAWQEADVTTTVSELVGEETGAYLGRLPDVITPNGWQAPPTINPTLGKAFLQKLAHTWELPPEEPLIWLLHSGRPELVNKGTNDLLEAIRRYQSAPLHGVKLGLLVAMPAEVEASKPHAFRRLWVSHELVRAQENALYQKLRELALGQSESVFLAYLPVYLEGRDGVVNVGYYDLLAAVDGTAFPSRYEPWGYTPQESIGVGVPTLSSLQAGYGHWMKTHVKPLSEALWLVDHKVEDAPGQILDWLYRFLQWAPEIRARLRREALVMATYTSWEQFFPLYVEAYEIALRKKRLRQWDYKPASLRRSEEGRWGRAFFRPNLPEELSDLSRLAYNLWWSWHAPAQELFAKIDPLAWEKYENPVWLLNHTPKSRWQTLLREQSFQTLLSQVIQSFDAYLATPLQKGKPTVLYLCLEYAFMRSLPIYSGGLGVLAADYLKELSDQAYPAYAVGLLYRYGYFEQEITAEGEQVEKQVPLRFSDLPLRPVKTPDGRWVRLEVPLGKEVVYLKVWQVEVGRLRLYLLDADLEENRGELRTLTHQLYPADSKKRLAQEVILGVGAEYLVRQLGLSYEVVHYNEGHPVFHFLAQVEREVGRGFSLEEAIELCRARTLFTTHTPVPAGHDAFPEELMREYLGDYVEKRLGWAWEVFMEKGYMPPRRGVFNLTAFGVWAAARVNAVSQLHAKVTQKLLKPLYPSYLAAEIPVVGITNGVHIPTWRAPVWERARRLWETHVFLKRELWQYLQRRLQGACWSERYLEAAQRFLEEDFMDALVLGFARRVATYKRHRLLLESQRMAQLFEKYPFRLILAGKAHPADNAGKEALQALWKKSLEPPFFGKVLFIPGYDLTLARYLVQGVDVWVNLPVYGQEASGTSGMKAILNGVLHLSVPDGWWAEVDADAAGGWSIPLSPDQSPERRDPYEALSLAALLEQEVWPAFAQRDAEGLPQLWIARMEKAQAYGLAHFGTNRMAQEYITRLYQPMAERYHRLTQNEFSLLRARVERYQRLQKELPNLKVQTLRLPPFREAAQVAGEPFTVEVEIEPTDIPPEERHLEIVFEKPDGSFYRFELESVGETRYRGEVVLEDPGVYHWALRFYGYDPGLGERWYEGSLLVGV